MRENSTSRGFWVQFLSTNDVEMYNSFIPEDVFKSYRSHVLKPFSNGLEVLIDSI